MEISDQDWQQLVDKMDALRAEIESWPVSETMPDVARCEHSRHRTLAHLRAAQETWLAAVNLFDLKANPSVKLPHPWRLFTDKGYESVRWEEHMQQFLDNRRTWLELVRRPGLDRNRGGKLSGKPHTIASLSNQLVQHESYHVLLLK